MPLAAEWGVMKKEIEGRELDERIRLNFHRLADDPYYGIPAVFSSSTYDWQGDKEGRALLAFVCHYKMSGEKIPCMEELLSQMPERTNGRLYFGPVMKQASDGRIVSEQQLSGHSWLLRGLCEHYEAFGDAFSLAALKGITEHLYLPTAGAYASYPISREHVERGGVSGTETGTVGAWRLSSDIGCAFMSIDGLSHVFSVTRDARVRALVDEMITVYSAIDKRALRAQTHCTLTAARGMMRMFDVTGERHYLEDAAAIYELYVHGGGMTATYQNLNWWGRPNTWTEPCAIVDSLMLALALYKATGEAAYRTMAARIYHNGLATAQRANGGAGTDSIVCADGADTLFVKSFEAPFCCTMRLAEGLYTIRENRELLYADISGVVTKNADGTYSDGDLLYAEVTGGAEHYAQESVEVDGHRLSPIVPYYRVPRDVMEKSRQKILFYE